MDATSSAQDQIWGQVERSLQRIDEREETLRALLPEPERAARLAREWRQAEDAARGAETPPLLFGWLIGVKDVVRVDGFTTRAGSALPPHEFDGPSALCVDRLREAGALVLGKTVTAEFACRDPGATANPRNVAHTPGGSSSGSAAAVAAGYCPAALGTQTIGSIVRPAAYCGIVGFKPSHGRVPGEGVISYSPSVDCVGVLAKDVETSLRVFRVMADHWQGKTAPHRRVLVPAGSFLRRVERAARAAFDQQVAILQKHGIDVAEAEPWESFDEVAQHATALTDFEFADVHRAWFTVYGPMYRPISAAVYMRGLGTTVQRYQEAKEFQLAFRERLHSTLETMRAEAWVCPSALGPAPEGLESTGDPILSLPWTFAGLPTLSLPAGCAANGLPLGIQLAGRFNQDESLLTLGTQIEPALAEM